MQSDYIVIPLYMVNIVNFLKANQKCCRKSQHIAHIEL